MKAMKALGRLAKWLAGAWLVIAFAAAMMWLYTANVTIDLLLWADLLGAGATCVHVVGREESTNNR